MEKKKLNILKKSSILKLLKEKVWCWKNAFHLLAPLVVFSILDSCMILYRPRINANFAGCLLHVSSSSDIRIFLTLILAHCQTNSDKSSFYQDRKPCPVAEGDIHISIQLHDSIVMASAWDNISYITLHKLISLIVLFLFSFTFLFQTEFSTV